MLLEVVLSDLNDRYAELEAMVSTFSPEFVGVLKSGTQRLVFFREDVTAPFLSDSELRLLGAMIKVAGRFGQTIVIGPFDGVAMLCPKATKEFETAKN
jgi:hypothetical protein